ncbi:MAG: rod-binding protein [Lachnospiraceae bacterium]|jgi:flagellar protein FlgJ|nr:rod-binding protein [Lachnospiraceae bacterium]
MDIGSLYNDYLTSTATKASNLERTLNGNNSRKSDDELLEACKQFEAYFYEQVFKNMEKAMVPKDDDSDPNNTLVDYYKENLIAEYSKSIVNQSGGNNNSLAQQLYEQMKRNNAL